MADRKNPQREKSRMEQIAEGPPIGMDNDGNLNIVGSFFTEEGVDFIQTNQPRSLVDDVRTNVVALLGVSGLDHRFALSNSGQIDGERLVGTIHRTILGNYGRSGASENKSRSTQNWRWQKLNTYVSDEARSPEVIIERAVAKACERMDRKDWANQVPVSSGLVATAPDNTRAIDLVHKVRDGQFEFIELKVGSNTPLFAAIEIITYGCIWLVARGDKPSKPSALLDADHIDLRVLAPAAYYFLPVDDLERALDVGVRALGNREGVKLSFAFKRLDERIKSDAIPDDQTLLECLDHSLAPGG